MCSLATLDYVLLAEFARVDPAGLLTAVGASFDRVQVPGPGAAQQMAVALRVLLDADEQSVDFRVGIDPPGGEFAMSFTGTSERNARAQPVDGKIAVLVAVNLTVPLPVEGRYAVAVALGDVVVKTLPFVVEFAPQPSA
jgi:uncharacterized protein YfaP (DUF2135 family)